MALDPYDYAYSFQAIIDLNVRYLRGEKIYTPYHGDGVDEETIPLLTKLVKLNQQGFLSTEGQPTERERRWVRPGETGSWGIKSPQYTDTWQKSYIRGIIPCTVAQPLAAFLETKPVYFEMFRVKPLEIIYDTFPTERYVLTKWRASTREADLAFQPFKEHTVRQPIADPMYSQTHYFRKYPHIVKFLEDDCVEVSVAARQFGEGSVEDVLLEFYGLDTF